MSFTLQQILDWTGGRVVNSEALGDRVATLRIERPSSLGVAKASELAFFFSRAYENELPTAHPGVLITAEPFVVPLESAKLPLWKTTAVVACADPYSALALLSEKFAAELSPSAHFPRAEKKRGIAAGIHPSAVVSPSAHLGDGVTVGAHVVIEENVWIGAGATIYPGCYVGAQSKIGEDSVLFPRVTLYEFVELGKRVRLHSGVTIGADGFGYAPRRDGKRVVGHQKIYHLGRVIIGDDVEIGANSCVDRATFGETRIEKNVKLDNLVHIGHNCRLDEGAVICGGTCLAGNASVGKYAYVGGLVGITNHVHVGDGGNVGALTLLTKDVPSGGVVVGNPQRNHKEHFKAHALLNQLLEDRKSK